MFQNFHSLEDNVILIVTVNTIRTLLCLAARCHVVPVGGPIARGGAGGRRVRRAILCRLGASSARHDAVCAIVIVLSLVANNARRLTRGSLRAAGGARLAARLVRLTRVATACALGARVGTVGDRIRARFARLA